MKTKILLSILALGLILNALGQNTIELTFTAIDSATYVQLDSIKVMNRSQVGDTVLYYPDTVLVLDYQVGISETDISSEGFQVFQNYPNPVINQTNLSFYVPERDKVSLIVTDILGRDLIKTERILDQGYHSYLFTPENSSLFLFTVRWRESTSSIKILKHNSVSKNTSTLEYFGRKDSSPQLKATKDIRDFLFSLGDKLLYIGYYDTLQSGMVDIPEASEDYAFQFATNIPCPGTPSVTYEGQVYNTVQIFSQCWLKENLNVGIWIFITHEMEDNDIIEKYCNDNQYLNCQDFGGLYQWHEMMQYNSNEGSVQGICPEGWHIPSDEEWKILEGSTDSQYKVGDPEWDRVYAHRGFDSGSNLKSINYWETDGSGKDKYGFSGRPGGLRFVSGSSTGIGTGGFWWTSTIYDYENARARSLDDIESGINRYEDDLPLGQSVRCIKD